MYIIKKILNNNVVIGTKNYTEYVLVGKAIGYEVHKGDTLLEQRVENIFIKQKTPSNNFDKVLESIDNQIVGLSEEIISMCEKELELTLSEAIHVSLPDHISFAKHRTEKGIKIENPFLQELTALYPKEYKLAEKALRIINQRLSIELPEDEIGFICMHIKAAISNEEVSFALAYTRKLGETMEFISKLIKKNIEKNSLEYVRTVTHINLMLQRAKNNKTIKNNLIDSIKKELYTDFSLALKVAMKIENLFSIRLSEDEIGYLALHLRRLSEI